MKSIIYLVSFIFFLSFFNSCASKKRAKVYKILTIEQANERHIHFSIKKPKNWNIYIEGHGYLIYSPLGTDIWKKNRLKQIEDSISRANYAKKVFEYNKINELKKGSYNSNYISIISINKDSLKLNSYEDCINWYINNQNKKFQNNFNYKIIKEKDRQFGRITYFEYKTNSFFKKTYLDALIIGKNRVYIFNYSSENIFYNYYLNDVLNIIKSLKIKE